MGSLLCLSYGLHTYRQFQHKQVGRAADRSKATYFRSLYDDRRAGPGIFPLNLHEAFPTDLCSLCNCDMSHIGPNARNPDINEDLRQIVLNMYCSQGHLDEQQALRLLRRSATHAESTMSWSLPNLTLERRAVYLTTVTSPHSKAARLRPQYFRRHGRAIRSWMAHQNTTQHGAEWQVLWIVVEDDSEIDPTIVQALRKTRVPYIYIAYGPTNAWGNAQKNAVLQLVHELTRPRPFPILGHGPVYGLDDDNKILPGLLDVLVKVMLVGVFPVGNLGSGWEAPVVDEERGIVKGSTSPWGNRDFPFDYGGYTFNSSALGTLITGPEFWEHRGFGGEDVFLRGIVSDIEGLEPLCVEKQGDECHLVWHNEELSEIEKLTDEEEMEYAQRNESHHGMYHKLDVEGMSG